MKQVAVVGGGASGFAAAITIARKSNDFTVTIYERLQKPLKKILATGNGRCNLTNANATFSDYFGDAAFAASVLEALPPDSNRAFFNDLGLLTKEEEMGRVYPASGQASAVRETLLCEVERLAVRLVTDCEITDVRPENGGFRLNNQYFCDVLLLCAGGSAAPSQGTDGGAFSLLRKLGHTVITPAPALTALVCKNFPKTLKGVRCDCTVTLFCENEPVYQIDGEVQFTDYGLSGIPIMQLSRLVSTAPEKHFYVKLNCLPQMRVPGLAEFLQTAAQLNPEKPALVLLEGVIPKNLASYLLLTCRIHNDTPVKMLSQKQIAALAEKIQNFTVSVETVRGFDFAQVTAGGADCREFNSKTLQSKKYKNLYVCGESLNVDGGCGGYNLHWAWSSGRAAGAAVVKENTP